MEIGADPKPLLVPEQITAVLDRILASDGFASSPRLQAFLTYIVEQELNGRGSAIKGKIIATDVYGKELDENGGALNLVRVEARRLRRGLEDYYSGEGHSDALRISMQIGGYRPQFERTTPAEPIIDESQSLAPARIGSPRQKLALLTGVLTLFLAIGVGYQGLSNSPRNAEITSLNSSAELAALRERSMTSVQAANLAEQAQGMFFPLFDLGRQSINLEAFRHVIDLDPNLAAGYAGSAQVLALKSILTNDTVASAAFLSEALEMAARATTLDPTDGWAQAAHGWTLAVAGDTDGGLRRARIAAELEPQDGHTLDLIGITALIANEPSLMVQVSHPERSRIGNGRFAYNSIYGASQLMLENYDEVIEAFSTAAERGHPVSAPSLLLLATAHHEIGNTAEAQQTISEMWNTWPGFPAHAVTARFFVNEPITHLRVLSMLEAYSPS